MGINEVTTFSEETAAGQRLMVGFDGFRLDDDLKYLIDTLNVGGLILFTRNVACPPMLADLCQDVQAYARSRGLPPLLIAIDQEGGQVARLKPPFFTAFPGNPEIRTPDVATRFAGMVASELLRMGINMNLAPVVDVSPEGFSGIMASRAFPGGPEGVSELGAAMIREFQKRGIAATAKHFPGIGRTTLDSHLDLPALDGDRSQLETFDLPPFRAAMAAGVSAVMLSHVRYEALDPQWPASLSPAVARTLLREEMGYDGLVLTDDLDMGAIRRHYDMPTAVRQALAADVDMILICHRGPNMETAFEEILQAHAEGPDNGRRSLERILRVKSRFISEAAPEV